MTTNGKARNAGIIHGVSGASGLGNVAPAKVYRVHNILNIRGWVDSNLK